MQDRKKPVTIPLLNLGAYHLCPIAAINNIVSLFPVSSNDPLFVIPHISRLVPLTDSIARKHLKNISNRLALSPPLTFHAFRRAGAMWSFHQGVPLEHIMKHGTWKSGCSVVISFLPSFFYLTRFPCFSTITSSIVLLGFG